MLNTAMVQILNCLLYLQVIIASWEMTLLLVLVKIVVAGAFGVNISRKVTEERSTLRREFYIKFAKVSVDLVLCTYTYYGTRWFIFLCHEPWACVKKIHEIKSLHTSQVAHQAGALSWFL